MKKPTRAAVACIPVCVTAAQRDELKALSQRTLIPQQALIRTALDALLRKHREVKP